MRIVSLVPSITELLYDLQLHEEVVGITKFCVRPHSWYKSKVRVGGTKTVDLDKVVALDPDLIIANREENDRQQIEKLSSRYDVWITNVHTISSALDMIRACGERTNRADLAQEIADSISEELRSYRADFTIADVPSAYFIWREPLMVAGGDTFIHHMMQQAGFDNVYVHHDRYPETDYEQLRSLSPQVLLLSSEPFPFKEQHRDTLQRAFPEARVVLVDGEIFSWYGSRMLQAPAYFRQLRTDMGL